MMVNGNLLEFLIKFFWKGQGCLRMVNHSNPKRSAHHLHVLLGRCVTCSSSSFWCSWNITMHCMRVIDHGNRESQNIAKENCIPQTLLASISSFYAQQWKLDQLSLILSEVAVIIARVQVESATAELFPTKENRVFLFIIFFDYCDPHHELPQGF